MTSHQPSTHSTIVLMRIRVFGALAAVCVLVLLGLIGYGDFRSRHHTVTARTSSQARTLAGHAARTFDVVDVTLAQLADRIGDRWYSSEHSGPRQRRLLAHAVAAMHFVQSIEVISPHGQIVFSSTAASPPDSHPADRDYVRQPLLSGLNRLHIGDGIVDATRPGHWLIPVSRHITDSANQPLGVIVAYINASFFQSFYDSVGQGGTVDSALVNGAGQVVAASTGLRLNNGDQMPLAPAHLLPAQGSEEPTSTTFPGEQFGGSPITSIGLARVEGWPLWTITVFDSEALTSDWILHIVLLSCIGVVVILATREFQRVIIKNLRRLDTAETELRRRVEDLEASQNQLERQSTEMAELAEQIAQARDEAEQARGAADHANRAKSDFLARMSHELRTPLNAILGFSEIMKDRIPGLASIDTYAQYAGDIHDSGTHLLSVINDILDLSKVEAGRFELGREPVELRRTVISVVRLMRETALRREIRVETQVGDNLPYVLSDARVVKQMLLNLLSNALKFTLRGGMVSVTAERCDGGISVIVRDTGVGIARKDFAKVLEPFGQVKDASLASAQGTGLGLPLVKSFIELHGGRFALESQVGEGTTVSLWFPPERTGADPLAEDEPQRCAAC